MIAELVELRDDLAERRQQTEAMVDHWLGAAEAWPQSGEHYRRLAGDHLAYVARLGRWIAALDAALGRLQGLSEEGDAP